MVSDDRAPLPEDAQFPARMPTMVVAPVCHSPVTRRCGRRHGQSFVKKQAKDSTLDFAFTFSLKLVYCVLNRFMVLYVLNGRFSCTAWVLSMYWADVSHETNPCLVCWIPDITDWPTLQLKPFNLRLNLQ